MILKAFIQIPFLSLLIGLKLASASNPCEFDANGTNEFKASPTQADSNRENKDNCAILPPGTPQAPETLANSLNTILGALGQPPIQKKIKEIKKTKKLVLSSEIIKKPTELKTRSEVYNLITDLRSILENYTFHGFLKKQTAEKSEKFLQIREQYGKLINFAFADEHLKTCLLSPNFQKSTIHTLEEDVTFTTIPIPGSKKPLHYSLAVREKQIQIDMRERADAVHFYGLSPEDEKKFTKFDPVPNKPGKFKKTIDPDEVINSVSNHVLKNYFEELPSDGDQTNKTKDQKKSTKEDFARKILESFDESPTDEKVREKLKDPVQLCRDFAIMLLYQASQNTLQTYTTAKPVSTPFIKNKKPEPQLALGMSSDVNAGDIRVELHLERLTPEAEGKGVVEISAVPKLAPLLGQKTEYSKRDVRLIYTYNVYNPEGKGHFSMQSLQRVPDPKFDKYFNPEKYNGPVGPMLKN